MQQLPHIRPIAKSLAPQRIVPPLPQTLSALEQQFIPGLSSPTQLWRACRHKLFYRFLRPLLNSSQAAITATGTSWQDYWMREYYLRHRLSLPFFSNYSFTLEDAPFSSLSRAARLVRAALEFYCEIQTRFYPTTDPHTEVCGEQYHKLFATCRIPGEDKDQQITNSESQHIMVLARGQFFYLPVCANDIALEQTLGHIYQQALTASSESSDSSEFPEPQIALFTSLPRPQWHQIYQHLQQNDQNRHNLHLIRSALFILSLDLEEDPATPSQFSQSCAQGNLYNRWFDHAQQILVFSHGKAGLNCEHGAIDGEPAAHYLSYLFQKSQNYPAQSLSPAAMGAPGPEQMPFQKLTWQIDARVKTELDKVQSWVQEEKSKREVVTTTLPWGKKFFGQHNLPADSCIQLTLILALRQVYPHPLCISESISMRHTQGGRYDSILSVTPEIEKFLQHFLESQMQTSATSSATLLPAALASHRQLIKDCKNGRSSLFHILCLLLAQKSSPRWRPQLDFNGISLLTNLSLPHHHYSKNLNYDVTTSNAGAFPGISSFGFTDTASDVWGVAYLIRPNETVLHIKADGKFKGLSSSLAQSLPQAFHSLNFIESK